MVIEPFPLLPANRGMMPNNIRAHDIPTMNDNTAAAAMAVWVALGIMPAISVIEAHNVVFADIIPALHLDHH